MVYAPQLLTCRRWRFGPRQRLGVGQLRRPGDVYFTWLVVTGLHRREQPGLTRRDIHRALTIDEDEFLVVTGQRDVARIDRADIAQRVEPARLVAGPGLDAPAVTP